MNITLTQLKKIAPRGNKTILEGVVKYFNKYAAEYRVDSYNRVCHFIAQAAHETDHFKVLEEYASGKAYEGRRDLGNTQRGDGVKYKGRGIFMYTGRFNYTELGKELGVDLVKFPKKLQDDVELAVLSAFIYWKSRNLNKWADTDDVRTITKRINGGYNGLDDRKTYLARAKKAFKNLPNWDIASIQQQLVNLGYVEVGNVDGYMGPKTSSAIVAFKIEQTRMVADNSISKEFLQALENGKPREVSEERSDTTVSDLRKDGSKTVRGTDIQTIGGGIAAGGAAIKGISDSGILDDLTEAGDTANDIVDAVAPFQYLIDIFNDYWWVAILVIGLIVVWQAYNIAQARLQDHKTGNTSVVGMKPKNGSLLSRLNPF